MSNEITGSIVVHHDFTPEEQKLVVIVDAAGIVSFEGTMSPGNLAIAGLALCSKAVEIISG